MRILFVHQNMPGQYKHLAPALAKEKGNDVAFITREGKPDIPGIQKVTYRLAREAKSGTHQYLNRLDDQLLHGQGAARAAIGLRNKGFRPDVIAGHSGWGETLYLKDVFPDARLLTFNEFFYRARGADTDFGSNGEEDLDRDCRTRTRNAHMLLSLEAADWGVTPTWWQWSVHPEPFRERMSVIHDGVNTTLCQRKPDPRLPLDNGEVLTAEHEVITYMARNLEPYRGFHIFVKGLETLCKERPNARFVIIGGDGISYGNAPGDAANWREKLMTNAKIDPARVHFMGKVPYDTYRTILSLSRAHIYLTFPFVLSWSVMEAMSHECLMIASGTKPVGEVIRDGENGLLFPFDDHEAMVAKVVDAVERPEHYHEVRKAARRSIVERYDLETVCLPRQKELITLLADHKRPPAPVVPDYVDETFLHEDASHRRLEPAVA